MTVPAAIPEPERLLADHAWARRLARGLVRDAARADDLAQEACLRALQRPPRGGMRAWLGGVVRNLARQEHRERERRERREELASRPELVPSAASALERLLVQQDVVRAVLALAEPYRSTIVLRFYENQPPRVIAARQGVPVATVKTRLARGLAELRAQLDHEHGADGRAWVTFLLPLTRRPAGLVPLVAGALAVNTLSKLVLGGALVLAVAVWMVERTNRVRAVSDERVPVQVAAKLEAPPRARDAIASTPEREASLPVAPPPAPAADAVPIHATRASLVVDTHGVPVGGVGVGLRSSHGVSMDLEFSSSILWDEYAAPPREALAISAPDGRVTVPLDVSAQSYSGYLVAADARYETVLAAQVPGLSATSTLVVAPYFHLRGRVVDPEGRPLAGAQLAFVVPRERVSATGLSLDGSRDPGWRAQTDESGAFEFPRLPSVGGALLRVRLEPYLPQKIERAAWVDDELEIVLAEPDAGWLTGVVESAGKPLAGATVALGFRATQTEANGTFRLSLAELEKEDELVALARGLLPARVKGDRNADGTVRWPGDVRIVLAGEALALAGKLVDENEAPLAGHEIWLEDPGLAYAEAPGFPVLLESVLVGTPEMRHGAKTGEDGRFRIEGLEERDYRLRVIDPKTALLVDLGPFAAGDEELVLRRPGGLLWPRLRGRVETRTGTPLAGIQLRIDRDAGDVGLNGQYFGFLAYGTSAVSGADGTFELLDVPREGATLHAQGPGIADPERVLDPALDPENVRIQVALSVELQVRTSTTYGRATSLSVLDASGTPMTLRRPTSGGYTIGPSAPILSGTSEVVRLSDEGVTLVLYDESFAELGRVPLQLQSGAINAIDL